MISFDYFKNFCVYGFVHSLNLAPCYDPVENSSIYNSSNNSNHSENGD